MFRYPTYMAVETLTIALVTEDGQSFEDLGIEEREAGQVIIKCRAAEPMRDGAPCEWNKMGSDGYPFCASSTEVMRLREQNAKLREQMEQLVTLLRNDCDIDASWDGLRRFWSIELTEDGCLMRDRVCKAEAENTKLWIFAKLMHGHIKECCDACGERGICDVDALASELGIEVKQ